MSKPDIVKVPYFVYDNGSPYKDICLGDADVLNMLDRIKKGASPFDVIPFFRKDIFNFHMKRSFPFGRFESRREMHCDDGEIFDARTSPEQIGKLLVPYYKVLSREDMTSRFEEKGSLNHRGPYGNALDKYIDADFFYSILIFNWEPLDSKKVFVLSKEQLE